MDDKEKKTEEERKLDKPKDESPDIILSPDSQRIEFRFSPDGYDIRFSRGGSSVYGAADSSEPKFDESNSESRSTHDQEKMTIQQVRNSENSNSSLEKYVIEVLHEVNTLPGELRKILEDHKKSISSFEGKLTTLNPEKISNSVMEKAGHVVTKYLIRFLIFICSALIIAVGYFIKPYLVGAVNLISNQ